MVIIRTARYALIAAVMIIAPVSGAATAHAASAAAGHARPAMTVADTPWGSGGPTTPTDTIAS